MFPLNCVELLADLLKTIGWISGRRHRRIQENGCGPLGEMCGACGVKKSIP